MRDLKVRPRTDLLLSYISSLQPPKNVLTSQFVEEFIYLPQEGSSEPGKFRNSRVPYLIQIMDSLDRADVHTVVFRASTQVTKTSLGINYLLKTMLTDPSPMMLLLPNEQMAKSVLKDRVVTTIKASPELRKLMEGDKRAVSTTQIRFPGGSLYAVSAKSADNLRSRPIKVILADEVDSFEQTVEGDVLELAKKRQQNFVGSKLIVTSTPVLEQTSVVTREFLKGDQRYYYVPCPFCREGFRFELEYFTYETYTTQSGLKVVEKDSITCICPHCSKGIPEEYKTRMVTDGIWKAEDRFSGIASFHINQFYSLLAAGGWHSILQAYEDALATSQLQVFTNVYLGLAYRSKAEQPDWKRLYEKAQRYPVGSVPNEALILTAGMDVQSDRLECLVEGHGPNLNTYAIDYLVLPCDTSKPEEVRNRINELLNKDFLREDQIPMRISRLALDIGYKQSILLDATTGIDKSRLMLVKGYSGDRPMISAPKKVLSVNEHKRSSGKIWILGVDKIKEQIYSYLGLEKPLPGESYPYGYRHYPELGPTFFQGLTCEVLEEFRDSKGHLKYQWKNPRGSRNEPLDCSVYSRAASYALGIDTYKEDSWLKLKDQLRESSIKKCPSVGPPCIKWKFKPPQNPYARTL